MDLYRTLRSLRDRERGIKPDAAWVHATRETLLMQVRNTIPTAEVAAKYRVPFFGPLYRRFVAWFRGPVLATISISGVVLGGSIASVSAADTALPGDALYTVKLVTEQAQLAFTSSVPDKVKLKASFTKRRVDELKTIIAENGPKKNERAGMAADGLKRDLDTLKRQLTDVQARADVSDTAKAAKEVDKKAVEVVKALAETRNPGSPELSPDLKEKVAAAQAQAADVGIQALEVLVATNKKDGGDQVVSSSDLDASVAAHTQVAEDSLAAAKAAVSNIPGSASSTQTLAAGAVSSTQQLLTQDAEQALASVQQLSESDDFDQVINLLKDATIKSLTVQTQADLAIGSASSSSMTLDGTDQGTASSTASNAPDTSSATSGATTGSTTTTKSP